MKFRKFLRNHWKAVAAVFAIIVATTIGVVMVRAATVILSVDTPAINFKSDSEAAVFLYISRIFIMLL